MYWAKYEPRTTQGKIENRPTEALPAKPSAPNGERKQKKVNKNFVPRSDLDSKINRKLVLNHPCFT